MSKNEIRFYGKKYPDYLFLSNFFEQGLLKIDGKTWRTVEHYYQAMKSSDEVLQEGIRNQPTPRAAKQEGQKVKLRDDWEEVKYEVMKTALRAKFSNSRLKAKLLLTQGAVLIEASPTDYIWGEGASKTGQNLLGKALMEVRAEILKDLEEEEMFSAGRTIS